MLIDGKSRRVSSAESAKVLHGSVFPDKTPGLITKADHGIGIGDCVRGKTHDLTVVVHRSRNALVSAFQCSEIDDLVPLPEDGPDLRKSQDQGVGLAVLRIARDQTIVRNPSGAAAGSSREYPQVLLRTVSAHESVRRKAPAVPTEVGKGIWSGGITPAYDLAPSVQYTTEAHVRQADVALGPAECSQVDEVVAIMLVWLILCAQS